MISRTSDRLLRSLRLSPRMRRLLSHTFRGRLLWLMIRCHDMRLRYLLLFLTFLHASRAISRASASRQRNTFFRLSSEEIDSARSWLGR
jgi:hypothetical protein